MRWMASAIDVKGAIGWLRAVCGQTHLYKTRRTTSAMGVWSHFRTCWLLLLQQANERAKYKYLHVYVRESHLFVGCL